MKNIIVIIFGLTLMATAAHAADTSWTGEAKVPVTTGKYITGGILGSTLGFGIGHGVQGRYADKGWIFTAGEVAGLLILTPAAAQCAKDNENNSDKQCSNSQKSIVTAGYLVFLGFHIWEVVDVWTGATPVDEKVGAFIIPTNNGAMAGLSYRF
ncbi:MAG: hypothetical protein H7061_01745 [Bdellovibrionaceae bacterium]|nr:hypothetical protein [Bdellovibrio sp.]